MEGYLDRLACAALDMTARFETVVIYSDFRFLVARPDIAAKRNAFMQGLFDRLEVSDRTFVTPSYTYTSEGDFHTDKTRTNTSALSSWLAKSPLTTRSEHPMFSYVGFGPNVDVLRNVGKSAFGEASLYDRLKANAAGFLHLGRPIGLGNTMVHHVEHMCGATYRVHKTFPTKVFRHNEYVGSDYTSFLRRRDVEGETFTFNFERATDALMAAEIVEMREAVDDMPYLAGYALDPARRVMVDMFHADPTSFVSSNFQQY